MSDNIPTLSDIWREIFDINKVLIQIDENDIKKDDICAICLDDLNNLHVKNNKSIKLLCNHIFCYNCINIWLNKNITCPICKEDLEKKLLEINSNNNDDSIQNLELPDDILDMIALHLPVRDIVALSMTNCQLRDVMRNHQTTDKTPIFTTQVGVRKVWPYLPFVVEYPNEGCNVKCVVAINDYFYIGRNGNASKFNFTTGEIIMVYFNNDIFHSSVNSLCVCERNGSIFTGSDDGSVRMFDIETGEVKMEYKHNMPVYSVLVCDNYLFTGCGDGIARMFDIQTGEVEMEYQHNRLVWSVCVSNGSIFAGCGDGMVTMFDIETGELQKVFPHDEHVRVRTVCVSNGRIFTGCGDGMARMFDIETGNLLKVFLHSSLVRSMCVIGNRLYTGCWDKKVRMFDIETGKLKNVFPHTDIVNSMCVCESNGSIFTGGCDGMVRMIL